MFGQPAAGTARFNTLGQAVFPQQTLLRQVALVIAGALFIAVSAQISVKLAINPVPLTGQTFSVLLVGSLFGFRMGFASAALYIALGLFSLPVYAGQVSKDGFDRIGDFSYAWAGFTGGSGGYLMSYPFVAALVGWLSERGWDRRPVRLALAMFAGNVLIYAFGLTWLYYWGEVNPQLSGVEDMTLALTLQWGLIPFIPGDLAKLLLAAGLVPSGWHLLRALKVRGAEAGAVETPPVAAPLAPLAAAAGAAIVAGALLPWTAGIGINDLGNLVVLVAGLAGAVSALLRSRRMISSGIAQLVGFATGALAGLIAFVTLVEFTATGELGLADFGVGVPVAFVAALVLLAATASEAASE